MGDETITDDPVEQLIAARGAEILERVNDEFADSMLLVGRVLGGRPAATAAVAEHLDPGGVDVRITDDGDPVTVRIDFPERVTDPMALTANLLDLVVRARVASGEGGRTTPERELAEQAGIRTFLTTVTAVEDVHPHLRRITFGGGDLDTFAPIGPDTFCYVLLPPPGRRDLTVDQSFTWERYGTMPSEEQPVGAYYTVRSWRPSTAELDMLFVLHDHGAATTWAARAVPGDPVALWGPRTAYHPPPDTTWLLLVADETGLPAVATIVEQRPPGLPVRVLAEVASAAEHQELPAADAIEVTWLYRDGAPAGTTTLLVDAVRSMDWPGGRPYVWGAGESRAMTAIRRHVRDERGLERSAVSLVAYWRHAASPVDPED